MRRKRYAEGLRALGREAHTLFVEAERQVLAEQLQRLDVDLPYVRIDGRHHRLLRSQASCTSAVGPREVERTLYRVGLERAVVPLEPSAGIA